MKREEKNDKILNMTKHAMVFVSIAGLLIMSSVLQSTKLIVTIPFLSNMVFAQQQTPTKIVSTIRTLLNQAVNEYKNQNFTGALSLATSAYLDHFEFIEAPLEKHDKALKNETEIMLREQLRQMIRDKSPEGAVQQLVNKININLDNAERLLADTQSPIETTSASRSANQTNLTNRR